MIEIILISLSIFILAVGTLILLIKSEVENIHGDD
tara:strand:- start:19544 stop:19648 length:105 start_codon:yes stop_codon:yes gene_type:complete